MVATLLERTRIINKILQKSQHPEYEEIAYVLTDVIGANAYIIDMDGFILGYSLHENFECEIMYDSVINKGRFPDRFLDWLKKIENTMSNLRLESGICTFNREAACVYREKFSTIVPIYGAGNRIGTLSIAKFGKTFTDEDLILAEYGATVVGMEILRNKSRKVEEDARKKATVQVAIATLSYSELEAMMHILTELEGLEGLLVASKIADRVGITRSVIVNALRKFESAGVIESKSLGMKGTYIKVLNNFLLDELNSIKG